MHVCPLSHSNSFCLSCGSQELHLPHESHAWPQVQSLLYLQCPLSTKIVPYKNKSTRCTYVDTSLMGAHVPTQIRFVVLWSSVNKAPAVTQTVRGPTVPQHRFPPNTYGTNSVACRSHVLPIHLVTCVSCRPFLCQNSFWVPVYLLRQCTYNTTVKGTFSCAFLRTFFVQIRF